MTNNTTTRTSPPREPTMRSQPTRVEDIAVLDHAEAMTLAATEYGRLAEALRPLRDDEWTRPTDCDE